MQSPEVIGAAASYPCLLTFAIPTFNRAGCLKLLLDSLLPQAAAINAHRTLVEIVVCNNGSTDNTVGYLQSLSGEPALRIVNHVVNLGPDANAIFCFEHARGEYVWIFGDDDLPLAGVLARVVDCLERERPDLVYLPAKWHKGELDAYLSERPRAGVPLALGPLALALKANAYITFISSWVVSREAYRACTKPPDPARYLGTSLPQLEWTLSLLAHGRKLFAVDDEWVIARAANSGGYPVFKVFVTNYNRILDDKLRDQPVLRRFLHDHMLRSYLPGFVWGLRQDSVGQFADVDRQTLRAAVRATWPAKPVFVGLLELIGRLPKPLAWLAFAASWLHTRVWLAGLRRAYTRKGAMP